jgi:hypothetical protein
VKPAAGGVAVADVGGVVPLRLTGRAALQRPMRGMRALLMQPLPKAPRFIRKRPAHPINLKMISNGSLRASNPT